MTRKKNSPSPSPRWRAVLVGCGGMSRAWIEAAQATPGLHLAGLVDLRRESAQERATGFGLTDAVIGTDLDAVLAETKANLLLVCTVPEAHLPNILAGLRHGCHVLTEKPLAATLPEARRVLAASSRAKRVVAVTQNYRYQRAIRSLHKFLAAGKIGRITGLDADFYIGAHFGGFRDAMQHVLLLDMSIHAFDMARFLAGGVPKSVMAHEWNPANSWYAHGASTVATFEFGDGIVFNYRGSWCSQGFDTGWNGSWRILGERGAVRWDGTERIEAEIVTAKTGFIWPKKSVVVPLLPENRFPTSHTAVMRDFVQCLETGRTPETVVTDNIHSLAMVHGAIASAKAGRRMKLG
jgi:predicted dehydrogenase